MVQDIELAADEIAMVFGAPEGTNPSRPSHKIAAAYTSFDGDYLADVGRMCLAGSALGYLPLNPEATLGYYVSTVALGNKKAEVMKACLAVEFKADEFWIISTGRPDALKSLPEGVVAEYLIWRELRPDEPVRHFPWLGGAWRDFLNTDERPAEQVLRDAALSEVDHEGILSTVDPEFERDLDDSLLQGVREGGVMPVAFLSTVDADDKHIDWAREFAYVRGRAPFSASTVLPKIVSDWLNHSEEQRRSYRDELIVRADELWMFARPSAIESRAFDSILIRDARVWMASHPGDPIRLVGWNAAQVPKYDPEVPWALTEAERRQT